MNCNGNIAKSIALECSTPIEGGYTGRNILLPYSLGFTLTKDADNPRIVKAVALAQTTDKVVAIDNGGATPHSGSTTTGNADAGRPRYVKLHTLLIPQRGADTSKDLIEPLVTDPQGFLLICEKRDKRGLGSYEVKGLQSPMKVDPSTITRDEDANGAAIALTLTCTEDWVECNFFDTDYATTKAAFDTLYAKGY